MRAHVSVAIAFIMAAGAASLSGCRSSSGTPGGSTDVMATEADFGTTKQLRVGQILDLGLPDNPSTRYT